MTARDAAERAWRAAIGAVRGDVAVRRAIRPAAEPVSLLAVGKAASAMTRGVLPVCARHLREGLVITKDEAAVDAAGVTTYFGNHPVPGEASVAAGEAAYAFLDRVARQSRGRLIVLLSGGASALMELPRDPWTLDSIQREVSRRLAVGDTIHEINAFRRTTSRLKGGRAAELVPGHIPIDVYVISDVEGDDLNVIGSGPFRTRRRVVRHGIVANLAMARAVAAQNLGDAIGGRVHIHPTFLRGTVEDVADAIIAELDAQSPAGWVGGGEPVVRLPSDPGYGGRATHLAAILSMQLRAAGLPYAGLVAGTDGSDGVTDLGGAFVAPGRVDDALWPAIRAADTGSWALTNGTAFRPGATGTNVNDLVLLVRSGDALTG
ncbi:MAG: DUF4147 domain-containing protein [Fimbriimonadaceae bacterium]|nr:DUF4147 domain-containing protein [Fimbriimonadaceae bacterium]